MMMTMMGKGSSFDYSDRILSTISSSTEFLQDRTSSGEVKRIPDLIPGSISSETSSDDERGGKVSLGKNPWQHS
jgi:hypothetical protein